MSASPKQGWVAAWIFGGFWTVFTLLFDGLILVPAARQALALGFSTVPGVIQSSQVTHHTDSEGDAVHDVDLCYRYTVAGREYTGTRYRYGRFSSSDRGWAQAIVGDRPAGTRVTVYYDPRRPQNSVLQVGVAGSDLFLVMFMTPFNAVMLGSWWGAAIRLRARRGTRSGPGVKVRTQLRTTRVRLMEWSPLASAIATVAVLAFIGLFVVGFVFGGFHPELGTMLVAWLIVLSGGFVVGGWLTLKAWRGDYDLVIDELHGMLELPAGHGRKERRRVPIRDVERVWVELLYQPAQTEEETPQYRYALTMQVGGAQPASERFALWYDKDRAEAFAAWLQGRLPERQTRSRPLAGRF